MSNRHFPIPGGHEARRALGCLGALALLLAIAEPLDAQLEKDELLGFLRKHIGFSDRQLRAMEAGQPVTKPLDTSLAREVAVFGVIWIAVPIDYYLQRFQDIEHFESSRNVLGIGKLSDPPRLDDFARLTFPPGDLEDIHDCRPGNCEIKLSEAAMQRLQTSVDWSAPDAGERANALLRQMALELVQAYLSGGNRALGEVHDKKQALFFAREFSGLLDSSPYLPEYLPRFHDYIDRYPDTRLPGVTDFLYWSEVEFGLKPLVRINHVSILRDPPEAGGAVAIASKQLYSSHYFHAALELRFLIADATRPGAKGFYLVSLNRARADGLTGFTGFFLRRTIKSRSRNAMERYLRHTKRMLEEQYGAAPAPGDHGAAPAGARRPAAGGEKPPR